ncbi:hypothetical protein [Pelagicoccus albus]|uniref:Uncharacterized protein n=1 Tax=Pelagicoccus albus TaxID=415222 RepID=A0A7X1E9Q6_9BACT|nr:hypothetical protein [Pelagicoccus albus]MBC2607684.1 hypothetical protein [Pelagicoccus albus]
MLLSLLFLIILAIASFKSRKIVIPAILFGILKAASSCFYVLAESDLRYDTIALLAGSQLLANGLLGAGIAYLVVKHAQDWRCSVGTTFLAVATFLTSAIDPLVVA